MLQHPSSIHSMKTASLRITVYLHIHPPFSLIQISCLLACQIADYPSSLNWSWSRPFECSWLACSHMLLAPSCSALPGRSLMYFWSMTDWDCCRVTRLLPIILGIRPTPFRRLAGPIYQTAVLLTSAWPSAWPSICQAEVCLLSLTSSRFRIAREKTRL